MRGMVCGAGLMLFVLGLAALRLHAILRVVVARGAMSGTGAHWEEIAQSHATQFRSNMQKREGVLVQIRANTMANGLLLGQEQAFLRADLKAARSRAGDIASMGALVTKDVEHINEDLRSSHYIEGIRAFFQKQALDFQANSAAAPHTPRCKRDILYVIITAHRKNAVAHNISYLKRTVQTMLAQKNRTKAEAEDCLFIVDNTYGNTVHVQLAEEVAQNPRIIAVRPNHFPDEMPTSHEDQTGSLFVASNAGTRKQILHTATALMAAYEQRAPYIVIVEDDMPPCTQEVFTKIEDVVKRTTGRSGGRWKLIRVGYGGNGMVLQTKDLPALVDYMLAGYARRPIDWIIPEWAAATAYAAQMQHKGAVYTYRYNLFEHIGALSNFGGRHWAGDSKKDGLPGCFRDNFFLRGEELFDKKKCGGKSDISPC